MQQASNVDDLTGIAGVAARGIDALGEWGVGLFTFAETIVPPIPSEVILPLAGFLWNALLLGFGVLLGAQYRLIEEYSKYLNYAVYAAIAGALAWLSLRAYRRRKEHVGQNGR